MTLFCDCRINSEIKENIEKLGYNYFLVDPIDELESAVASHPDMQLFKRKDGSVVVAKNAKKSLFEKLDEIKAKIILSENIVCSPYPFEVSLNACFVGDTLFCNTAYTDKNVLCEKKVHINQGYARCSILPIAENAFITQDKGISKKAKENGFEVLEVNPYDILLEGHNHGFIGGCGGLVENTLLLYGKANEKMREFAKAFEIEIKELYNGPLTDFGSIIAV
ncbi:MAG: hypothetical protein E7480_08000 [Ruminococcaceae bacterium]|nr:hypothetical protein [Oscillospiraceae bacterium]